MATAKATETAAKKMVKYKLPVIRGQKDQDQFVSVNGETYIIQRGKEVEIPDYIAEVLDHSEQAADEAESYINNNSQA